MPHRHSRPKSTQSQKSDRPKSQSEICPSQQWEESNRSRPANTKISLTKLIEQDSPLQTNSQLVLMYGPFQTEMLPEAGQGVASWIKDCLRKHGLPSLVRFDYRRRAQIFRRDEFQPWLEPLIERQSY
ncbi:MAG: hypothetical protein LH702_30075 [Phormidesmis sp. CAN_BIN44]|nr:hypothetical protein [Phormidesmis sp. CAN_BIN44]